MPTDTNIETITYAGHDCLRLSTRHGIAIVSLHGAHLLSWVPTGQRDVFWLSTASLPEPAAIRGGVPICWPWFAKQGQPDGAQQHGPVRNLPWEISHVHTDGSERVHIALVPCRSAAADAALALAAPHLRLALHLDLTDTLVQTLETENHGANVFMLSQALHSYFAVHDATQVQAHGLAQLHYADKLLDGKACVQQGAFRLDTACDRVYQQAAPGPEHHYTLDDAQWQRRIHIRTQGSNSMVVWNPGAATAHNMVDIADDAWPGFLCLEVANAGEDVVMLAPGGQHRLTQTLMVETRVTD